MTPPGVTFCRLSYLTRYLNPEFTKNFAILKKPKPKSIAENAESIAENAKKQHEETIFLRLMRISKG